MEKVQRLTIDQLSDRGCLNVLCAMLKILSNDFTSAYTEFLKDPSDIIQKRQYFKCRHFFVSDYFRNLTNLDGRKIVEQLESIIEEDVRAATNT